MAKDHPLSRLGSPVDELELAARERLVDAKSLFDGGRYASAISYGVYSVEILLKVLICKRLNLAKLPIVFHIHDLQALLLYTGLTERFVGSKSPRNLAANWSQVVDVSRRMEGSRYKHDPVWDQDFAERFLLWLQDGEYGVASCLRNEAFKKTH